MHLYPSSSNALRKLSRRARFHLSSGSCHSSWLGFDVNDGIFTNSQLPEFLQIQRNITWKPYDGSLQTLANFNVYSCNVGIYTGEGDTNLVFDGALFSDISLALVIGSHDIVRNSIVVRDSGNTVWTGLPPPVPFSFSPPCALLLYDGPARFDHVHLVGFDSSLFVTAFRNAGAARRRTGISMVGITTASNLAGAPIPGVGPNILWEDFSGSASATDPQRWAYSIDNPDLTLGRPTGNTLPTVVCSHPMMLLNPGTIEFALPNSTPLGGPPVAFCSPFRFGYLRVISEQLSGPKMPLPATPNDLFKLRYTRHAPNLPSVVFDDTFLTFFHKQMAVIVDASGQSNGVSYNLAWTHPSVTAAPLRTEIRLSELQYGDAALIRLENYLPITGVNRATALNPYPDQTVSGWEPLQGANDIAALLTSTESGYFEETSSGTLWLRFVAKAGAPGAALVLHADGLGQVLEVTR